MPWKKDREWYWDQTQWNPQQKRRPENKNTKEGRSFMTGYDGRRIDIEEGDGFSGPSWSASSQASSQEAKLREENAKLKAQMKSILTRPGEAPKILPEVIDLVKDDPRELLKARQRELNAERKALNKLCKVKDEMMKKEQQFQSWKQTVSGNIQKEEKRHTGLMAEMQSELKRLEKGELDEPEMLEVDSDSEEGLQQETHMLKKELKKVKAQFREFTEYSTQLEVRNSQMLEAMQAQMTQLIGAVSRNVLTGSFPNTSPKQEVKPPLTIGAQIKKEREELTDEKRGRSRTPPKDKSMTKAEMQYRIEDLQQEIQKYPAACQQKIMQVIQERPQEFATWQAVIDLSKQVIDAMMTEEPTDGLGKEEEGTMDAAAKEQGGLPLQLEHPCQPFRRFAAKSKSEPYATPKNDREQANRTPDGGRCKRMDIMS